MALKVNIKGGTRGGKKNLCETCSCSIIAKGAAEGQEFRYCHSFRKDIPCPIIECNGYSSISDPNIQMMVETAWVIETKKGRVIGFVSPEEFRKKHAEDEPCGPNVNIPDRLR